MNSWSLLHDYMNELKDDAPWIDTTYDGFDEELMKKTKLSWTEYVFTHLIPTWFMSFNNNFVMWRDLITEDYEKYTLLPEDDPYQECYNWFWCSINLDETYPKFFLEDLLQMVDDIDTGKVKTYPMEDVMETLKTWLEEPDELEKD